MKKNKTTKKDYNRFWIHKPKVIESLVLALSDRRAISFLKISFAVWTFGCIFLKMKSFLTDQIAQHIRIATIIKKTGCDWFLIWVMQSFILVPFWKDIFSRSQLSLAKGQSMNKCWQVSSSEVLQRTQRKESSCIFFLLSIFLVLSLSFSSNQKNTLCFGWQ